MSYYDPATAQFLSVDPLIAATRSAYGYAANDPINGSDPTGMLSWPGLGAVKYMADQVLGYSCRVYGTRVERKHHCNMRYNSGVVNAVQHFIGSALLAYVFVSSYGPTVGMAATDVILQGHEVQGISEGIVGTAPWCARDAAADQFNNLIGSSFGEGMGLAHLSVGAAVSTVTRLAHLLVRHRLLLDYGGGHSA